jgi:hypothetical protein
MKKIRSVLAAAGVVMIISACGSTSGTSTNAQAHTTATSPTVSHASASGPQLEAEAQHLMSRLATLSGQLASSPRPSRGRVRAELAQLQTQLRAVSRSAARSLAGNDPARALIIRSTQRGARAAQTLEQATQTADTQRTLTTLKTTLAGLSTDIGQLRAGVTPTATSKVLTGLHYLEQQLSAGAP